LVLVICFALCVASVPLSGGSLAALASFAPRHVWAVFAAVGMQIGIISILPGGGSLHIGLHLASYALLLVFLVANSKVPGLWIICLGTVMNFVAIASNGGVMPATKGALARAGLSIEPGEFANSAHVRSPKFAFLGDVFALPDQIPFANVFSAGDVCIVLGALLALHQICATRFFPPRRMLTPLQPLDSNA
jgi:Family of unknown function (DUF5317)